MKTKKTVVSLLIMAIVTAMMPVMETEVKAEVYGNFEYAIVNGTVEITKYTGDETDVVVPAEIDGYKVTSIGAESFLGHENLISVELPSSITNIGDNSFRDCAYLESINIPDGVTNIGMYAFYCAQLLSVEIPDSVTSIGVAAFGYCNFTSITIPDSITRIEGMTFDSCYYLESIEIPESVTYIGAYAFSGCSKLTKVTMTDNVTEIGPGAFKNCSILTNIVLPKNITSVGFDTFYSCKSLQKIVIPESVTSIGMRAFYGCHSLKNVNIPYGVTTIPQYTFFNCLVLPEIEIPETVTSIDKFAFHRTGMKSLVIPSNVTSIGNDAFSYNLYLESVVIPNSVTSIGNYAFENCSELASVVIPDSVTSIGSRAFNKTILGSVELTNKTTEIGANAFPTTTVIYGYTGSTANTYATTYGNGFVSIGDDSEITESEAVEINGYQMNVAIGGIRTVYSVEPEINGLEVVERGLLYGLAGRASKEEMHINEETDYVVHYAATPAGLSNISYSDSDTAATYVMTMTQSIDTLPVAGLEAGYYVRAYAKLSDGTYVYSTISEYSIFSVAKILYDNELMANADRHQYLYDKILSVVQPEYTEVEYTKSNLVLPD